VSDHEVGRPGVDNVELGQTASPSGKIYRYHGATFASERQLIARFLDDLRAAESFGAEVVARWAAVTRDPLVRGGLRTVCARERSHGELLARRLEEIGGACTEELSVGLKEAASTRLASSDVPDLEKLRDFVARYPGADAAVKPLRDVILQIEDDLETRALLGTIADDEIQTQRWMATTFTRLTGSSEEDKQSARLCSRIDSVTLEAARSADAELLEALDRRDALAGIRCDLRLWV